MKVTKNIIVLCIFFVVFAFSTIDHAISPLVNTLAEYYSMNNGNTLLLITYCTIGIVIGIIIGPYVLLRFSIRNVVLIALLPMIFSLSALLLVKSFPAALLFRFVFGLGSGLITNIVWWATYSDRFKEVHTAMVNTVMSARPMAVALGVPLIGYVSSSYNWRVAFLVFLFVLAIFGFILYQMLNSTDKAPAKNHSSNIFLIYSEVLRAKKGLQFYGGLTINRMCYFGFYSMLGIWFAKTYNLSGQELTKYLLIIGLIEAFTSFIVSYALKWIDINLLFNTSIILSIIVFISLIMFKQYLALSVVLFSIFVFLDRVYSMILIIRLPKILINIEHKAILGTMVTISAWFGLAIITYIESILFTHYSITTVELFLLTSLVLGLVILAHANLAEKKLENSI